MSTKCFWCQREAVRKDYRSLNGTVNKIPSCAECFWLDTDYLRGLYDD